MCEFVDREIRDSRLDGEREREKSENELMGDYREGEIKGEKRVFKMKKKKKKKGEG